MIKHQQTPFIAHVFVCTNDRKGARKSCADADSQGIKDGIKEAVNNKGWKGKVRVSTAGCLGVCDDGPNVIIYPQGVWFSAVDHADIDELVSVLEGIVKSSNK